MTSERTGAYNHTGVGDGPEAALWRPFVKSCVRQARGADMRVAEGGRQAGSGSQAALG